MKGFALAAALVLALVVPAAASADSIVYVKDGNVWLSSADASKQYQVTFDGGYSSPSQADDGTIGAIQNKQLVKLDRSGKVLSRVDAMGTGSNPNFYGPYEARLSPDGTKFAYWFGVYTSYYSGYVEYWHVESQTTWSYADHFTDPSSEGDYYKGITQPEWLTNDRLLAGYDFWMTLWTYKIGTGHGYTSDAAQYAAQFKDSQGNNYYFGDPAESPDGTKLALTDGGDATMNNRLFIANTPGPLWVGEPPYTNDYTGATPVEQPILWCFHQYDGALWNPTWSRSSVTLAYSLPDGVHAMDTTNYQTGGDCPADRLLIPGGAEPAFGPKDIDMAQAPAPPAKTPLTTPDPGKTTDGQPRTTDPGQPTGPGSGAFTLTGVALKPASFRAAKAGPAVAKATGSTLRFTASAPANLTLTVKTKAGKAVKGAIKTAAKPGANTLRFMGRIGGRTLKPGGYRLTITSKPLAGPAPKPTQLAFKIVR